ncbi:hypothetical protein AALI21_08335 [Corynebacteriaceae bacterium 6-324]
MFAVKICPALKVVAYATTLGGTASRTRAKPREDRLSRHAAVQRINASEIH